MRSRCYHHSHFINKGNPGTEWLSKWLTVTQLHRVELGFKPRQFGSGAHVLNHYILVIKQIIIAVAYNTIYGNLAILNMESFEAICQGGKWEWGVRVPQRVLRACGGSQLLYTCIATTVSVSL